MIKLVPIESIHASDYNPRKNDEKRLHLAELSLRKLGFLLPIYATEDGEILSGHQRTLVAKRIGFEKVPVVYVENRDLKARKGVNLMFNRATNDLAKQDTCEIIKARLYKMDIDSMIDSLPDIDPNSEEAFPCIYRAKHMDVVRLAKKNHRKFNPHIRQLAKALENKVGLMPIVIDPEENVINGIGRLEIAADAKRRVITVVPVIAEQAELSATPVKPTRTATARLAMDSLRVFGPRPAASTSLRWRARLWKRGKSTTAAAWWILGPES